LIKLLSPIGESGQLYLYYKTGIICQRTETFNRQIRPYAYGQNKYTIKTNIL